MKMDGLYRAIFRNIDKFLDMSFSQSFWDLAARHLCPVKSKNDIGFTKNAGIGKIGK